MDWLGLSIILAQGLALAVVLSAWAIARKIRRPPRRTYASAVARGRPGDPGELSSARAFTEWFLEWRGVRLPVWDIPGDAPDGPAIVLTPGWGDSRIGALTRLPAMLPLASRVLAWDLPGMGEAPDWPRGWFGGWPMGTVEHEALRALVERSGASRVVLYGWSAGAGIGVVAAGEEDPRIVGVIAEAPYRLAWTPARNVLRLARMPWGVVGPLAFGALGVRLGVGARWRGFDRAEHARRVAAPLLVLHGSDDEVCPLADGEAIARAAARGVLAVIRGGRHNDLWTDERFAAESTAAVRAFVMGLD